MMLKRLAGGVFNLRTLDTAEEMRTVEELQRQVWPGSELDIVPGHLLLAAVHNGGLVIGAYQLSERTHGEIENQGVNNKSHQINVSLDDGELAGFVFGFAGLYDPGDGLRLKHCSHMLGVHPAFRDRGLGFALKRAQWQLVRRQGVDLITWTYDPLQSRNANLNIAALGSVCNIYIRDAYGEMQDELNVGLKSDRFQVEWWVNSNRVNRRLSRRARTRLDLAHYLAAGSKILNPTEIDGDGLPRPASDRISIPIQEWQQGDNIPPFVLIEIPSNIARIKRASMELAQRWRLHTRALFEDLFKVGFLVSDFIYLPGAAPRSFYVLCYGKAQL